MEVYNKVQSGTKNVASTAAVLATSTPCRLVMVTAMSDNAGNCWIGDASVAADNGIELEAGGSSPWIPVNNVSLLYVIGTADDDVGWFAVG